ncbi:MAG: hypothetical protein K2Z81_09280 [Cyanobacteria bacterium]|nr:hypothetical protein [Cyanobacteriota bacterium]
MIEFKNKPLTGKEIYDKTGFYILWPLAAFPLVAIPFLMITERKEFFKDAQLAVFMILCGVVWTIFWGGIPFLALRADKAEAERISKFKARITDDGIEFDTLTDVCRMKWADMKSIEVDAYDEDNDVVFKTERQKFRYQRWLDEDREFLEEVRRHFPETKL